jgi:hypothetical protein
LLTKIICTVALEDNPAYERLFITTQKGRNKSIHVFTTNKKGAHGGAAKDTVTPAMPAPTSTEHPPSVSVHTPSLSTAGKKPFTTGVFVILITPFLIRLEQFPGLD